MNSSGRVRVFVAAVCATTWLALFSSAWACVPQPLLSMQPRASGPAGSQLTVEGRAMNGTAEIRWNGPDGELLAKADGPHFSVPITLPQTVPGLYSVVAVERRPDGSLGSSGSASVLVTAPVAVGSPVSTSAAVGRASRPSSSGSAKIGAITLAAALLFVGGTLVGRVSARRPSRRVRPS